MYMPREHYITQLLPKSTTVAIMQGKSALTQVRNQYWVIDDPKEVQNSDKECKVCERRRGQPAVQIMAPLPGSKPEKSVCKILCWLRWAPYNQDYTKIIC